MSIVRKEVDSIRERIVKQFVRDLKDVPGIATDDGGDAIVHRYDIGGLTGRKHESGLVRTGNDTVLNGPSGVWTRQVTVYIGVILAPQHGAAMTTDELVNQWEGRLSEKFAGGFRVVEAGTSEPLALSAELAGSGYGPVVDGQPEVFAYIQMKIVYRHARNSPYRRGGTI